jgi:hypothetical protein
MPRNTLAPVIAGLLLGLILLTTQAFMSREPAPAQGLVLVFVASLCIVIFVCGWRTGYDRCRRVMDDTPGQTRFTPDEEQALEGQGWHDSAKAAALADDYAAVQASIKSLFELIDDYGNLRFFCGQHFNGDTSAYESAMAAADAKMARIRMAILTGLPE